MIGAGGEQMELTKEFRDYLKKAAPEVGQPDDVGLGFLDDNSAVVTVEYVVPAERWAALEAEWEAQAAGG
jgi:hypothetical protein